MYRVNLPSFRPNVGPIVAKVEFRSFSHNQNVFAPKNNFINFRSFHTSQPNRADSFELKDLPGMKLNELKKLSEKYELDIEDLSKEEMIEQLKPFAKGAKKEKLVQPLSSLSQKMWAKHAARAKTIPPIPVEQLSLECFDKAKDPAEMIAITKNIFKDFGVSNIEILAEIQALRQLEEDEEVEEQDFVAYRKTLFSEIKARLSKNGNLPPVEDEIAKYFDSPLEGEEEEGAQWLKPYCVELLLSTILDMKPGFETSENWDEVSFLEQLNGVLESQKLRVAYDAEYDWEDTSGKQPLTINLETMEGKSIGSQSHTFPDPEEFDQSDLIEPINILLKKKGITFIDASWFSDEVANYHWLLYPSPEAERLEKKYGKLSNWYQYFPQRGDEEGEDEEGFEEGEEEEPVSKKKSRIYKKWTTTSEKKMYLPLKSLKRKRNEK